MTTVFNFTFLSQVSLLSFLFFSFLFGSSLFTFVVDFAFQHLAGFSPSLGRVLVLTLTVWLTLSAPFFPYLHAHATHFGTRFCAHPLSVMPCQHNLMCYSVLFFCACVCVCLCVWEWVGAVNLAAKVCNSSFIFTPWYPQPTNFGLCVIICWVVNLINCWFL